MNSKAWRKYRQALFLTTICGGDSGNVLDIYLALWYPKIKRTQQNKNFVALEVRI